MYRELSRKRNVVLVQYTNPDYYPWTINAARLLARRGHRVSILSRVDKDIICAQYGDGIRHFRLKGDTGGVASPITFGRFLLFCVLQVLKSRPDVIVGYDLHGLIAASMLGCIRGVPYCYHCYDLFMPDEGMGRFDRILKAQERRLAASSGLVIFPSESKLSLFRETTGLGRECLIVANSPPLQQRERSSTIGDLFREKGANAEYVILYQGSIGKGKGLETLLESMRYWPETAVLAIAGIAWNQEYLSYLISLARDLKMEKRFGYLGNIPFDRLYSFTRSAHLGVFLPDSRSVVHTHSGSAIGKLNDYMACGIPFIVSNYGPLEELARTTGAGVAVDVKDAREVGETIRRVLLDKQRWGEMSDRAHNAHVSTYNLERQYEGVLKFIERGIDRGICPRHHDL